MATEPIPNEVVVIADVAGHVLPQALEGHAPLNGVVVGPTGSLLAPDLWIVEVPSLHNARYQLHRAQFRAPVSPTVRERKLAEELAWKLNNPRSGLSEVALEGLEDHAVACRLAGEEPSEEVVRCLNGFRGENLWPTI